MSTNHRAGLLTFPVFAFSPIAIGCSGAPERSHDEHRNTSGTHSNNVYEPQMDESTTPGQCTHWADCAGVKKNIESMTFKNTGGKQ